MSLNKLALALSLAAFAMPLTAVAQEADQPADPKEQATTSATETPVTDAAPAPEEPTSNLSWNLSLNSDYLFRGYSLNSESPALQGGLDYSFGDTGFAVGTWASNVDFDDADGPDLEWDTYVSWNHDLTDDWNFNVLYDYYTYVGSRPAYGNINYGELFGSLTYAKKYKFTVAYANDYGNSGLSTLYYEAAGSWALPRDVTLFASLGYQTWDKDLGLKDYTNYSLGVSRAFGPVTAKLGWYGTDNNGTDNFGNLAGDRVFLSFGIGG